MEHETFFIGTPAHMFMCSFLVSKYKQNKLHVTYFPVDILFRDNTLKSRTKKSAKKEMDIDNLQRRV